MVAKRTKGKVVVSAEIPLELRDAMDAAAKQEGRSRSSAVECACRFWLEYAERLPAKVIHTPKPAKKGK